MNMLASSHCWVVATGHYLVTIAVCSCACISHATCMCVCACVWPCMYVCCGCCVTLYPGAVRLIKARLVCFLHPRCSRIWILLLEGHAHASKSRQDTHLASQARWSRSRCSFPDRTGRLPSRRSQRPSVCLYNCLTPFRPRFISFGSLEDENGKTESWRNTYRGVDLKKWGLYWGDSLVPIHQLPVPGGKLWTGTKETLLVYRNIIFELVVPLQPWCDYWSVDQ